MPYLQRKEIPQERCHHLKGIVVSLSPVLLSVPFPALTCKLQSWKRASLIHKMSDKNSRLQGIGTRWQQIVVPSTGRKSPQLLRLLRLLIQGWATNLLSTVNCMQKTSYDRELLASWVYHQSWWCTGATSKLLQKLPEISSFRCWT